MTEKRKGSATVAQTVAALGVVGSLGFVAIEIRQNTEAVRGATIQAVAQQSMDLVIAGLDNPEVRAAFVAGRSDSLTPDQEATLSWFFMAKLRADENRLRQVQLGILDESTFGQLSSNSAYRLPFFRRWWETNGYAFAEDFQALVEREFVPLSRTEPIPATN